MSYFAPYIDSTGLHIPTYADRMEDLLSSYTAIFGSDAVLTPEAPDYQLLSAFARSMDDMTAALLAAYNSRSPSYASGDVLDTLAPLYGITRQGATCSTATLTLTAPEGTTIPSGSAAADTAGRLWRTTEDATTDSTGTATAPAACSTPGQIYAAPDTITTIISSVPGWQAVTNPAASTLGLNRETDASLRARITSAMAGRSTTIPEAIEAAVLAVPNVRGCLLRVNDTDSADEEGIPPHTIAAVVHMGNQAAIAKAIFDKKPPGIGTWGSTTVTVEDSQGNTQDISFSRPNSILTEIRISMTRLDGFDEAAVTETITETLRTYLNALPIGATLNVPQLYGLCYSAVSSLASTFVISRILAITPSASTSGLLSLTWNERIAVPSDGIVFDFT